MLCIEMLSKFRYLSLRLQSQFCSYMHFPHYTDVIMTTMASQITSLTIVYSTVYSDADQRKHQSSASLAFVWGIHRDRWIPCTKGQLRGKCFHLMTSSCLWFTLDKALFPCPIKVRFKAFKTNHTKVDISLPEPSKTYPDSKVHGAKMGPIWGWQDPGGSHVGPMNLAIWDKL